MAKIGKADIFLSVIESHKGIIYKIVNAYCTNIEDRNDLAQDIVIRLWQNFDEYNNEFKYSTWIYRIVLNAAISSYRKEKAKEKYFVPNAVTFFEIEDFNDSPETEHNYILLQQFIAELKELDKALMVLYLEEKNYKEISEILGISESNVGTKVGRIKNLLKEKFSKTK